VAVARSHSSSGLRKGRTSIIGHPKGIRLPPGSNTSAELRAFGDFQRAGSTAADEGTMSIDRDQLRQDTWRGTHHPKRVLAIVFTSVLALVPLVPAALGQAPGPESFAKEPKTPLELWDAVDYLVRTGQPGAAVPYLSAFLKSSPDDAALLQIRDRYGAGSVLRLEEYKETRPLVKPVLDLLTAAARRHATDSDRLRRAIAALSKSREEQSYGLERLRQAGPYAIPALVETLQDANLPPETRELIVANMGRLDPVVVPALVAVLDSPDRLLGAAAADALASIGDARAIPFLTFPAAQSTDNALRSSARRAIAVLTGRDFTAQPKSPLHFLVDETRKYYLHQVQFPGDSVELWAWEGNRPVPKTVSRSDAEAIIGLRFGKEALALDPSDRLAQIAFLGLALEKAQERVGYGNFPRQDPTGAFAMALASGPVVLGEVARQALADGHSDLAVVALLALSRVADRDALARTSVAPNPMVEALSAPDRRVRFAAASALVSLAPPRSFPGASRVVPVLTSFVAARSAPRVVIVDGDLIRANGVGRVLQQAYGADFTTAQTGADGFKLASEAADVEAVLIEPTRLQGAWRLVDLITNLRADPRTAGLPIFLYGPEKLADHLSYYLSNTSRIAFLVTPTDPNMLRPVWSRDLGHMGVRPLSQVEREAFAQASASLLAQIASRPGNPFEVNISEAAPVLATALNNLPTSLAASEALGDVPSLAAQRGLAEALIDPSRAPAVRLSAANQLARNVQRFGRVITSDHERRLEQALDAETDPVLRFALSEVVGALRPEPRVLGERLRSYSNPAPGAAAAAAPVPAPAALEATPAEKPESPAPPIPDAKPSPNPPGNEEPPKG
jgi:HEAT repeat protein